MIVQAVTGATHEDVIVEAVKDLREEIDACGLVAGCPARGAPWRHPTRRRVPLRVTVAPDVADLWMAVRERFARRGGERRSFVAALSDNIVRYWTPEARDRPFEAVYRRDRYRCAAPGALRWDLGRVVPVVGRCR